MKKSISLLFAAVSALVFASCGQNGGAGTESLGEVSQSVSVPEDTAVYTEISAAPEPAEISEEGYTVYYFDAENGSDANSGLSEREAKQTLGEANALIKKVRPSSPVKILFKGGDTFAGELKIAGYSASESAPLMLSSYGESRALIDGGGNEQAISVTGGNLRLSGLEVVNETGMKGVYVYTTGHYKNLVIEDCYIHNVNWNWTESESEESYASHLDDLGVTGVQKVDSRFVYETGGIVFFTAAGETPCYLENVWVKDNEIEKVSKTGILLSGQWVKKHGISWGVNKYCDEETGYYPSRNVNFTGNRLSITGGDGIVMIGVTDGYIERNVSLHSNYLGRSGYACAGIWSIGSKNVTVQYNESAYSHLNNGAADGQGFDIDIASENIVFQYNYAHDNDGGGLLMCNTGTSLQLYDKDGNAVTENGKAVFADERGNWTNAAIRNNLFVNNGKEKGNYPAFANVTGSCLDVYIENNTIIFKEGLKKQPFMKVYLWGEQYGKPNNFYFRNNIFYSATENSASLNFENMGDECLFVGNVYYNMSESFRETAGDSRYIELDPGFTMPASYDGFGAVSAFVPSNAEIFERGLKLSEKNRYDILGSETKGKNYLGAICG